MEGVPLGCLCWIRVLTLLKEEGWGVLQVAWLRLVNIRLYYFRELTLIKQRHQRLLTHFLFPPNLLSTLFPSWFKTHLEGTQLFRLEGHSEEIVATCLILVGNLNFSKLPYSRSTLAHELPPFLVCQGDYLWLASVHLLCLNISLWEGRDVKVLGS